MASVHTKSHRHHTRWMLSQLASEIDKKWYHLFWYSPYLFSTLVLFWFPVFSHFKNKSNSFEWFRTNINYYFSERKSGPSFNISLFLLTEKSMHAFEIKKRKKCKKTNPSRWLSNNSVRLLFITRNTLLTYEKFIGFFIAMCLKRMCVFFFSFFAELFPLSRNGWTNPKIRRVPVHVRAIERCVCCCLSYFSTDSGDT